MDTGDFLFFLNHTKRVGLEGRLLYFIKSVPLLSFNSGQKAGHNLNGTSGYDGLFLLTLSWRYLHLTAIQTIYSVLRTYNENGTGIKSGKGT
jgi:hypothetical protein